LGRGRYFGDVNLPAIHRQPTGEVKITVVKISIPGDRNEGTTHESLYRLRIEVGSEFLHVCFIVAGSFEPGTKPSEGNIGKGKEVVEDDPPPFFQLSPKSLFSLGLRRREKSAGRVRHQVQFQTRTFLAIAEGVKPFQNRNRFLECPLPSLGLCLGQIHGGKRGDNRDPVLLAELHQEFPLRVMQGGQIGTKHDPWNDRQELLDEVGNMGIQFWRPAGNVRNFESASPRKCHHSFHGLRTHDFLTTGSSGQMAMTALLITKKANVNLEYLVLIPD